MEMNREGEKSVYFLSGIGTWKAGNFFSGAMKDLTERYRVAGVRKVHTADFYPYGFMDDVLANGYSRFIARQALAVSRDMYARYLRNRGGKRAFDFIVEDYEAAGCGEIVLIGHSGGGVAAYAAGKMLHDKGYSIDKVIMVGSPEVWIAEDWQNRVCRVHKAGRLGDPITWFGKPSPGAPRIRSAVNIVGGHPDYFRWNSFDQDGVSNLAKTMDAIWTCLTS